MIAGSVQVQDGTAYILFEDKLGARKSVVLLH